MADQTTDEPAVVQSPNAPAVARPGGHMVGQQMSVALQIMLDDKLFERVKFLAHNMSKAQGTVGDHLIGKSAACFAVVSRSMTWNLDPWAVAACTYQTPGNKVGYEGKLCHAIIEASNRIEGGVRYQHFGSVVVKPKLKDGTFGAEMAFHTYERELKELLAAGAEVVRRKDWSAVQGMFEAKKSKTGKDFMVPTWVRKDAEGLGVVVSAKIKGEIEPRELVFELVQAFPLNSTLWATDPKTQICYTAVRRFCNLAVPHLFMGVPFDTDSLVPMHFGPDDAKDITPARPNRVDFSLPADVEPPKKPYEVVDADGEIQSFPGPAQAAAFLLKQLADRPSQLQALVEYNVELMGRFDDEKEIDQADAIRKEVARLTALKPATETKPQPTAEPRPAGVSTTETKPKTATETKPKQAAPAAPVVIEIPHVKGVKNWTAYFDLCIAAVDKLKTEDEVAAWKAAQGQNLVNFKLAKPDDAKDLDAAIITKLGEITGAGA